MAGERKPWQTFVFTKMKKLGNYIDVSGRGGYIFGKIPSVKALPI